MEPIRVRRLHVLSDIQARFATTHVLCEMANRMGYAAEATFTAQLPDQAFITKFSMWVFVDF